MKKNIIVFSLIFFLSSCGFTPIYQKNTTESMLIDKIKQDSKLNEYLKNKDILKKIFIPNRLINILTN